MSLRPFSPQREDAAALSRRTVGRTELLESLTAALTTAATTASKPHVLLVGPRGAGKSHLVEVALYRAGLDSRFAGRTVVVRIPEDSNDITRFSDMQRRILRVVTPEAPMPSPADRAEAIEESLGDRVLVLVVENLDRVFADIGLEGQRNLRAWVETSRQVLLLATTPLLFPAVSEREQPWFGGLAAYVLPDLTAQDGQELVALLASARGDEELARFVRSDTGEARLRAVAQLTGGSPRVWMILAQVATKESLDELVPAVEDLLEGLVPYYQQLLWALSPTERQLVTRLSQTGKMTVADLAAATDIDPGTTANTLRRLAQQRWVISEKPRSGDKRQTYYGVREPLLRYHLQYREDGESLLELVVLILKAFFGDRERGWQFLDSAPGSIAERYLSQTLGLSASTNSLLMQPPSEYPLVALDWRRSDDPVLAAAGNVLCDQWRGVGVGATPESLAVGVERALGRDTTPGVAVLLRLVRSALNGPDAAALTQLLAEAKNSGSPTPVAHVAENLSDSYGLDRDFDHALRIIDQTLAWVMTNASDERVELQLRDAAAFWTARTGRFDDALHQYTGLLPDRLRVLGPDHPDTLGTRSMIAYNTGATGHPDDALRQYTDLLPDATRVNPEGPLTRSIASGVVEYARTLEQLIPAVDYAAAHGSSWTVLALNLKVSHLARDSDDTLPGTSTLAKTLNIAITAARGDETARAQLPPELLTVLDALLDAEPDLR